MTSWQEDTLKCEVQTYWKVD